MMKYFWVIVIFVVTAIGFLGSKYYQVYCDTDALINRAQIAGDSEDMAGYLKKVSENLAKHGMDKGHTAVIFTTPDNSLSLNFRAVSKIIERLDRLGSIDFIASGLAR